MNKKKRKNSLEAKNEPTLTDPAPADWRSYKRPERQPSGQLGKK
jgi:hypothetical protein